MWCSKCLSVSVHCLMLSRYCTGSFQSFFSENSYCCQKICYESCESESTVNLWGIKPKQWVKRCKTKGNCRRCDNSLVVTTDDHFHIIQSFKHIVHTSVKNDSIASKSGKNLLWTRLQRYSLQASPFRPIREFKLFIVISYEPIPEGLDRAWRSKAGHSRAERGTAEQNTESESVVALSKGRQR